MKERLKKWIIEHVGYSDEDAERAARDIMGVSGREHFEPPVHCALDYKNEVVARVAECPACHTVVSIPDYGHGITACTGCADTLNY